MSTLMTSSNVYYLPIRHEAPEAATRRQAGRSTAWGRLTRAWWRARFAGVEIWSIARRCGRHLFAEETLSFERFDAERFRPKLGPARIIDFDSARRRLRN